VDAARLLPADVAKKGMGKSTDMFSEERPNAPETTTKVQEFLKAIKGAQHLSTGWGNNALSGEEWRPANDADDEKAVLDGVLIDGPKAGQFIQYVKVDKKKEAAKKATEVKKTDAQREKERKERLDKILTNRSARLSRQAIANALISSKWTSWTEDASDYVMEKAGEGIQRSFYRCLLTPKEYTKGGWPKWESFLKGKNHLTMAQFVIFALELESDPDGVAKALGLNYDVLRKEYRHKLETEIAQAKADKAKRTGKTKKGKK
jgi:hypothetical protein